MEKSNKGKKLKPLNDMVVVNLIVKEDKTEGGILLPGQKDFKPATAVVIDQASGIPVSMIGKTIFFNRHTAVDYDKELSVIKYEHIYAIVD